MIEYIPTKHIVRTVPPNRDYLPYEYAMDIYRGCTHGCIYCFAPKAKRLYHTFVEACEKEGLSYDMRAASQRIRRGYPEFQFNLNS